MTAMSMQGIRDRHQLIRFFDGYSLERQEDLSAQRLKKPLIKTHLIELMGGGRNCYPSDVKTIFSKRGVSLDQREEGLYLVTDLDGLEIGFLELLLPRIMALYSVLKVEKIDPWVHQLVKASPDLDHVWFSGMTFEVLWQLMVGLTKPNRFGKLVFTHQNLFDFNHDRPEEEEEGEEEELRETANQDDDSEEIIERRDTRFALVDRISEINGKLKQLQNLYHPLYAISQMRFPSPIGRGGHDFYENGKVTDRSESFRDHRSHVLFLVRIYANLLQATEEKAWYSIPETLAAPGQFQKIVGAPVTIRFKDPLEPEVFKFWIEKTFTARGNVFRLWGNPIRLGPAKVHVYGVDRHLWQPLFLELTDRGCTAIIPRGTCGNTVQRLVTNIQRYLSAGADAFIGDKPCRQMVEESTHGVKYDPRSE